MTESKGRNATQHCLLDAEDISIIRNALLIGLQSYGEVVRLINATGMYEACDKPLPDELHPIDPTGNAETICDFASALRTIEQFEVNHD